jgi:hypothetical protein
VAAEARYAWCARVAGATARATPRTGSEGVKIGASVIRPLVVAPGWNLERPLMLPPPLERGAWSRPILGQLVALRLGVTAVSTMIAIPVVGLRRGLAAPSPLVPPPARASCVPLASARAVPLERSALSLVSLSQVAVFHASWAVMLAESRSLLRRLMSRELPALMMFSLILVLILAPIIIIARPLVPALSMTVLKLAR